VIREVQDCSHILHAGDIIRESDLDELALYGQLYAVRGNNDWWMQGVRDLAGVLRFRIGGVNFLMVHDRMDVPRDLNGVDVVVYGHSHRYS
jgi:predicted phosphodiesterase